MRIRSTPHLASSEFLARMIAQTLRRSVESALPNVDRPGPYAPAWFTPRGRPMRPTFGDCYHRAGGGP
jgi:hypothetical protein